jgi:peptidoglycan/LPS O-acetylase OafA/YrhL
MAIAVMAFHYVSWSFAEPDVNSLLGKLGIYAVSIFYILSGLSLSLVYLSRDRSFSVKEYVIKRAFRIFPLFWCCLIVVLILKQIQNVLVTGQIYEPEWDEVFLNFTLLFGFFMPDKYFSVGAWSIGNEIVFYSIFPFIVCSSLRFGKVVVTGWLIASALLGGYFSGYLIDSSSEFKDSWSLYVNPLNQIYFFVSGIFIAICFQPGKVDSRKTRLISCITLALLSIVFILVPVGTHSIDLVTGSGRLIMSILSILLVLNVYMHQLSIKGFLGEVLIFFGKCCYSIYLIHPIVALPLAYVLHDKLGFDLISTYILSSVITLVVSAFVYEKIEKPMMIKGSNLSKSINFNWRPNK